MSLGRQKLIEDINAAMFRETDKGCVRATEIADFVLEDRKRMVEECAKVAEHQKTICGMSMSRQSTCMDIAHNIRLLKENIK